MKDELQAQYVYRKWFHWLSIEMLRFHWLSIEMLRFHWLSIKLLCILVCLLVEILDLFFIFIGCRFTERNRVAYTVYSLAVD